MSMFSHAQVFLISDCDFRSYRINSILLLLNCIKAFISFQENPERISCVCDLSMPGWWRLWACMTWVWASLLERTSPSALRAFSSLATSNRKRSTFPSWPQVRTGSVVNKAAIIMLFTCSFPVTVSLLGLSKQIFNPYKVNQDVSRIFCTRLELCSVLRSSDFSDLHLAW